MNEYEDKNLAYFTFYPSDFLSSTMHLSNDSLGAYMRILCFLWKKKRARETELKAVGYGSVTPNETQWLSIIELLVNDGEFFWSKRMEIEREIAMKNYIIKCENGKKGGRPKKNNLNETENKPIGYDSVNLNETDGVSNQNQNHTFNHSSNDINEEDSFFLARDAQENQEPKKIEFEKIDRSVQNQIPTIEEAQAHVDYFQTKFKKKFDVVEWIAHWTAQNWIDKTDRPFDWRKKINDNSADPRFQIKAEKPQTTKEPFKSFAEQKTDHEDCEALRFRYGIIKHKHSTYEELKEIDRLARAEKAKNREQPSQETTNKLLGNIYANLIQTY